MILLYYIILIEKTFKTMIYRKCFGNYNLYLIAFRIDNIVSNNTNVIKKIANII